MRTNFISLALIILIGLSPLIRFSLDDIRLSRDTDVFIAVSILLFALFFTVHHSCVQATVRIIIPIFLIIGASSFLLGIFPANAPAMLFWIVSTCIAIMLWMLRVHNIIDRNILIAILIGCIGLYAQWGIAQFIIQHDLGMHVLGESRLQIGSTGVASFSDSSTMKYLRAYGPFAHPNSFAGVLLIGAILLYTLCSSSKIYLLSMLLLFAVGLTVSFSRTALIGFIVVLIAFWLQKRLYILVLISLVPLLVFAPLVLHRSFDPAGVALKDRMSGYAWLKEMATPISLLRGYGIGNYESALVLYLNGHHIAYDTWDIAPVHSAPLLLFTEFGLILVGILTALFFWFLRLHYSPILIALLPVLMFDHYFITQLGPLLLIITCTVIVVQYRSGYRTH